MRYPIAILMIHFLLISCETTETKLPEDKYIGYSHHFKIIEEGNGKLQVYSPIAPYPLIQTLELQSGESEKLKKIFLHQQTLDQEDSKQLGEDIEDLLLLLEERNKKMSDETQFEINITFAELLPHE